MMEVTGSDLASKRAATVKSVVSLLANPGNCTAQELLEE